MFTIFNSNSVGNPANCLYPNKIEVTTLEELKVAVSHDYVCATYKDSYRNSGNFIASNCLPVDCE